MYMRWVRELGGLRVSAAPPPPPRGPGTYGSCHNLGRNPLGATKRMRGPSPPRRGRVYAGVTTS
jgi:hypothetical protein